MTTITRCDRCRETTPDGQHARWHSLAAEPRVPDYEGSPKATHYDFCSECWDAFQIWLTSHPDSVSLPVLFASGKERV